MGQDLQWGPVARFNWNPVKMECFFYLSSFSCAQESASDTALKIAELDLLDAGEIDALDSGLDMD